MSQTLSASGVFYGLTAQPPGDLLPPQPMYDACRVLARFVEWKGGLNWDFSKLHEMPIPDEFTELGSIPTCNLSRCTCAEEGLEDP
ncbi:MAG: hypothetical protein R2856_32310 [Caldilineaceae bacterium]